MSFGSWGEKFANQKLARGYSIKTASGPVRVEKKFQRDWQNQRKEKKYYYVRFFQIIFKEISIKVAPIEAEVAKSRTKSFQMDFK